MILDQLQVNRGHQRIQQAVASDKPIRSIVKAISWRVLGTLDTLAITYIITGQLSIASLIASVDFATKMLLYFFHERIWNTIKWGR